MNKVGHLYQSIGLDAVIVLSQSNTFYLSGFSSSNCQIVLTPKSNYFITDMRYFLEAKSKIGQTFEIVIGQVDVFKQISDLVKNSGATTIGWDNNISYNTYVAFRNAFGWANNLTEIADKIEQARNIKTEQEIELIKQAQSVTEQAFDLIIKDFELGVTEIEIASKLEYYILAQGCGLAFESIVAFGKNTASPHCHRSSYKLCNGDLITLDFGAKYNGYCSDMTRTLAFGSIGDKQVEIYNTVAKAQINALDNIKSGITAKEADALAREIIVQAGYGEYFTHSLGHGVGVDIHEGISLSPKNHTKLVKNMVVTVEPGIYIEGVGGVRIEDMVIIDDNNVVNLTKSNKNLIIL